MLCICNTATNSAATDLLVRGVGDDKQTQPREVAGSSLEASAKEVT